MKDILRWVVLIGLFAIPFLPTVVANNMFFPYITGKNFLFRSIVEIIFAAWILLALYEPKYRPKFSWIMTAFVGLLVVMFVADFQGQNRIASFWSNFERMDGYITLVHLFLYTLVLGSMAFTEKVWTYFLQTAATVALFIALNGIAQYYTSSGSVRVDAQLGNSAYMAIYMLFNIFFVFYLALRTKNLQLRILYGFSVLIFTYALLLTGTRGTFLGLIGGVVTMVAYTALFARQYPHMRTYAIRGVLVIIVLGLGFFGMRHSSFIQHIGPLARIANLNVSSDLVVRETIWHMAWQGVKERPLLGWGQDNFNYVFNAQYDPSLYAQEQWFDRAHEIVFDWLIAGGFLGLIAYFSVMFAAAYYFFVESALRKKDIGFTVLEQAVLVGLFVAYVIHNLVVFDNIISYIFYGTLLALIHTRVSREWPKVQAYKIDPQIVTQFATPIVIVIAGFSVYLLNVPGVLAARDLIQGLVSTTVSGRVDAFETALSRGSFAEQEITEQLAQQAMTVAQNQNVSDADKQLIASKAEAALLQLEKDKPGDARVENFLSTFYRSIGKMDLARQHAAIATSLSPRKPSLIIEQAVVELQDNKPQAALLFLQKAFELAPANTQARVLYASVLVQTGNTAKAKELIGTQYISDFAANNYAIAMVEQSGDYPFLAQLFQARIAQNPTDPQNRASLAFVYIQEKDTASAIATLQQAGTDIPAFASTAACFVKNLKAGKAADTGCN